MMEEIKCDFCSSKEVRWEYPCEDFVIGNYKSVGAFLACEICSSLVELGEWEDLVDRTMEELGESMPARLGVTILHQEFENNRKGERIPYERKIQGTEFQGNGETTN